MNYNKENSPPSPTHMNVFKILHSENLLWQGASKEVVCRVNEYLKNRISDSDTKFKDDDTTFKASKSFLCNLVKRWKNCRSKVNFFLSKHRRWLEQSFHLSKYITESLPTATLPGTHLSKIGRPPKPFIETTSRTKRRRIEPLLHEHSPEELAYAAQAAFALRGMRSVASAIKSATLNTPRSEVETKTTSERCSTLKLSKNAQYTCDEALAIITNCKLTKMQYISLRQNAMSKGIALYPPYFRVTEAKTKCYPPKEKITIGETCVNIDLQALLDLTTRRVVGVQRDVISQVLERSEDNGTFKMICKWGTDGSSGHSLYGQRFTNPFHTDSDILQSSLVPLQLQYDTPSDSRIIWKNPRPSSTRFCRPIRFSFCKETEEKLVEEIDLIEGQIHQLQPTSVVVSDEVSIEVTQTLHKTMLDGKVCNVLARNRSSQVCYICGVSPKNTNNLRKVLERPCKTDCYSFGLPTLHARIRFLECVLHISYRLIIKKWRVPKGSLAERKRTIRDRLKAEMGILVDVVKQGKGTSNDGNTSRRFFSNPTTASRITGVDESLIKRFPVILDTICSGYDINIETFRKYTLETANLYVSLYKWFPMPASIHKILIHSADVMESILCPIGQLSEEAIEARHKEYRRFREHNTRKVSRVKTNEDLVHILLVSSDPVISTLRPLPKRKLATLSKDVLSLLTIKKL